MSYRPPPEKGTVYNLKIWGRNRSSADEGKLIRLRQKRITSRKELVTL